MGGRRLETLRNKAGVSNQALQAVTYPLYGQNRGQKAQFLCYILIELSLTLISFFFTRNFKFAFTRDSDSQLNSQLLTCIL